jgi:hypothetical protein
MIRLIQEPDYVSAWVLVFLNLITLLVKVGVVFFGTRMISISKKLNKKSTKKTKNKNNR